MTWNVVILVRFDGEILCDNDRQHTPVHDRLGGRVSVHDRLGGWTMLHDPAGGRIPANDRLEQMSNDRLLDDQPLRRDPERERASS